MQVTIEQLMAEHGFSTCGEAIEWSVRNGYKLRTQRSADPHDNGVIDPGLAAEICDANPADVFIHANPLGFDNPGSSGVEDDRR